jgi:hypothetical protein
MAFHLGSIFADLTWRTDNRQADMFGRKLDELEAKASKPIEQQLSFDTDNKGYDMFGRKVAEAKAIAAKPIVVETKVKHDSSAWNRFDRDANRLTKTLGGLGDAIGSTGSFIHQGAAGGGSGLSTRFLGLGGSLERMGPLVAGILPVITSLTGAVTALAASLTAAVGGAGALATAVGASFGATLPVLARVADRLSKVKDAYDAQQKAAQDNTKANRDNARDTLQTLSETEQKALAVLTRLTKTYDKVLGPAGDAVFAGLIQGVDRLVPTFEKLQKPFTAIGKAIGDVIANAGKALSGPAWTAAFLGFARSAAKLIKPVASIFGDMSEILRDVAFVSLPVVDRLFQSLADTFTDLNKQATQGKIDGVVEGLLEHTKAWWELLKETARLIYVIFNSGAADGKVLVEHITQIVKHWRQFLETRKGQEEMLQFFRDSVQFAQELFSILKVLVGAMFEVSKAITEVVLWFRRLNKSMQEFGDNVDSAINKGLVAAIKKATDVILGLGSSTLGVFADISAAIGKLPGGGKFKQVADDIRGMQRSLDKARESLRDHTKATADSRHEAERQREKVKQLGDAYEVARSKQHGLRKGTEAYKEAARTTRVRQEQLNDAVKDMAVKVSAAKRPVGQLRKNIYGLSDAAEDAAQSVVADLNQALKSMGAKPISAHVGHRGRKGASTDLGAPDIGGFPDPSSHATGGVPNPGSGARDDHVLLDPRGRPVAMMSGTEGILNTPQMNVVNYALGGMAAMGLLPKSLGGLGQLWQSGMTHHAKGGMLQLPASFSPTHDTAGLAGYPARDFFAPPGTGVGSPISGVVTKLSGQAGGPGGGGAYGYSEYISGSGRTYFLTHFGSVAVRPGERVKRGQFLGTVADYPDRADHIHEGVHGGSMGVAGDAALYSSVDAPKFGGTSPIGVRIGNAAGRVLARAANKYLDKQLSKMDLSGGQALSSAAGAYSKTALKRLWSRVNPRLGDPNLMAAIALAESGGNPSIVNSIGAGGLWQINPPESGYLNPVTNAKIAGRKLRTQGLRAWEAYTNGSYRQFLQLGGLIPHFKSGGRIGKLVAQHKARAGEQAAQNAARAEHAGAVTKAQAKSNRGITRSVARWEKGITGFESRIQQSEREYGQLSRAFDLSDEVFLVEHEDGTTTVDTSAVAARVAEMDALIKKREEIRALIEEYRAKIAVFMNNLANAIRSLKRALKAATGKARAKERTGYSDAISAYQTRMDELGAIYQDLGGDIVDSNLDLAELDKERSAIAGTQAPTSTTGAGSAELTPDQQAQLDQVATLKGIVNRGIFLDTTAQSVLGGITNPNTIGQATTPAYDTALVTKAAAMGVDLTKSPARTAVTSDGPTIVQNNYMLSPSDPAVLIEVAKASNTGNGYMGTVSSPRTNLGL